MAIELKMPALSPTMEEGTLAKWLVKKGDKIEPGDVIAEIETDKATMEFEAIDEGVIADIAIEAGSENVKVGTVIATLAEEGEDVSAAPAKKAEPKSEAKAEPAVAESAPAPTPAPESKPAPAASSSDGDRIAASPLARRIAANRGIDLSAIKGSGPNGRIVKADVEGAKAGSAAAAAPAPASASAITPAPVAAQDFGIPHTAEKLSNMRKTIARRLTESKQQVPHIYLTVDIRLDALLKLRAELNDSLASSGVKLSVNDLMIKALAKSLIAVPACNVQFAGDQLLSFTRADISVAVSIPAGLITPIVVDAGDKTVSKISTEMKDLAARAREGKLQPQEYQGGTASLSNMGMYGIKQFEAVINPPQGMIMAIGAGEKRPYVVDDSLQIATVMSATGSFDHRAIDGADGAQLMQVFKDLIEKPMGLLA
ncbi:pyruvate dehydrogenase complex dihydrolipoamide acetyltransferase [Croceicoccus naphthovorans]|uniref:Acetyltransferase component of pyruvate dehydrogenase complex n=1 Tax=Croceicoccus naphthovorans TaxID=1348774 RepID=A0A0G3XHG4_9SPHN|nr:pyruvate dehydrogenase complex dihydrolipoamide acetyltransferase [Croceicoccus naphthovorans]AKM10024.1 branched-chain alpha-keto acid dehydrogenase subunit E2 [Croceicoccus naphthovorans]MBB3991093.1 pyruvate dehydrogenase E2 component (dihydrolipoamide acetyltransferase) [Croceicoccus naphthovorans]